MVVISKREFRVEVEHSSDGVYIIKHSDVPGLVLESESLDEIIDALTDFMPELLESNLNILPDDLREVTVKVFHSRRNRKSKSGPRILVEQTLERG